MRFILVCGYHEIYLVITSLANFRKWVSLLMLVAQTVSVVFAMRLSRTLAVEGETLQFGDVG